MFLVLCTECAQIIGENYSIYCNVESELLILNKKLLLQKDYSYKKTLEYFNVAKIV